MNNDWESISFAELLTERKERFDPDAPEIRALPKIEKIDFAEGKIHLGKYEQTKTQQIIVEPGDFVFSGLNIEKGAAAFNETGERLVVSANYSTCHFNESRVTLAFFKHYMRSDNFQRLLRENLKKDYGFTRPKHLMPLSFLIPKDKSEQERIVTNFESNKEIHLALINEITHQESLLSKLKQAILQEAIEGKLTAGWRTENPDVESASELLKRIQTEKARLIAAKKLRAEKPLPPIKAEAVPFEVPEGWVWVRLGDVSTYLNGYAFKSQWFTAEGVRLVRNINISHGMIDWTNVACMPTERLLEFRDFQLNAGDIVLSLDRPIISTGLKAAIVTEIDLPALLLQRVLRISPLLINPEFLFKWLFSSLFLRSINPGRSIGIPHVSHKEVMLAPFPLPPFAEQEAIVERVEALMESCRALEEEIERAKVQAGQLLQAVLKEAFAGG